MLVILRPLVLVHGGLLSVRQSDWTEIHWTIGPQLLDLSVHFSADQRSLRSRRVEPSKHWQVGSHQCHVASSPSLCCLQCLRWFSICALVVECRVCVTINMYFGLRNRSFLFPTSQSEEGELLNSPSSVRPSVRPSIFFNYVPCPRSCSLRENHHYAIKAGNTRATRTLVLLGYYLFFSSKLSKLLSRYTKME